jgi:hypothetical protein
MSEQDISTARPNAGTLQSGHNFLRRQVPYLLVLALSLACVAYTNTSRQPAAGYWELLAVMTGGVTIFKEWSRLEDKQARFRLVWTQALHWLAVIATMNIMLLAGVQRLLPAPATSLVLLALLALGTFTAGLNLASLEMCFLGLVLALAVPMISWLKQSILLIVLVAVFVVGIGLTFWLSRKES